MLPSTVLYCRDVEASSLMADYSTVVHLASDARSDSHCLKCVVIRQESGSFHVKKTWIPLLGTEVYALEPLTTLPYRTCTPEEAIHGALYCSHCADCLVLFIALGHWLRPCF